MQFHIEKMTCGGCVKHVTQAIATVDPSAKVEADTVARKITVTTTASRDAITQALAADGYEATAI